VGRRALPAEARRSGVAADLGHVATRDGALARPDAQRSHAMSFKIVLLPPDVDASWPEKIRQAVPGAIAKAFRDLQDALPDIEDADAAYGRLCRKFCSGQIHG